MLIMAQDGIYTVICLALLIPSAWSNADNKKNSPVDIKQFLNTTELLWTYNTTAGPNLKCRVDKMMSIKEKRIVFQRSHLRKSRKWTHWDLQGKFDHWLFSQKRNPYNVILVSRLDHDVTHWKTEELLVYQDPDNKCGVFKIVRRGKGLDMITVELRMRNSSVHEGPSDACLNKYRGSKRPRQRSYGLYALDCQNAVEVHRHDFFFKLK